MSQNKYKEKIIFTLECLNMVIVYRYKVVIPIPWLYLIWMHESFTLQMSSKEGLDVAQYSRTFIPCRCVKYIMEVLKSCMLLGICGFLSKAQTFLCYIKHQAHLYIDKQRRIWMCSNIIWLSLSWKLQIHTKDAVISDVSTAVQVIGKRIAEMCSTVWKSKQQILNTNHHTMCMYTCSTT